MAEHKTLMRARMSGLSTEMLLDRACSETLDAAVAVHQALGTGHAAATYKGALVVELLHRGLTAHRDATFSVLYRGQVVGALVADILVDERVLVQVKADAQLTDAHKLDTLRGLAAGGVRVGLAVNFGVPELWFARVL